MEKKIAHPPPWLLSAAERNSALYKMSIQKEELLKYLKSIAGFKTISGIFQDHVSSSDDRPSKGIEAIQNITGVSPGIVTTRMPSFADDASQWQLFVDKIICNWKNGCLVSIVWFDDEHPLTKTDVSYMRKPNVDLEETKWKSLVENGGILNTLWKQRLDAVAPFLLQLQNAGVNVVCDLLPFLHLKHLFWRARPGEEGTVKLFRLTQDYLRSRHRLNTFIWAWSLHHCGDMTQLDEYWPGDEYVDVASVYMGGSKELGSGVYQKILNVIKDKPISLECSYSIPSLYLLFLHIQPRWTWFTTYDFMLQDKNSTNEYRLKSVFNHDTIINKGHNEFLNSFLL